MIRILFLITEFDRGGAEKALYDLVRQLDTGRFAPQVACLGGPGYYTEKYREIGIATHHLGLKVPQGAGAAAFPIAVVHAALRMGRLLRTEHIQVLQSFLFHANAVGRLAGRLAGTSVVLGAVRTAEPRHTHTLADGLTFWLTDGEVCVSEHVRRFQARRAGLPAGRLFVVPQGVEPADYPVPAAPFGIGSPQAVAQRRQARQALALPPERPVFAFVGRLCEAKALPDLLGAFWGLVRVDPAPLLAIAGDGPLAALVRSTIRQGPLRENALLLGWLDDPRTLYAAADCLVLSSVVEGMPRVVLEAMAAGLPVISTDAPGCDELVLHEETGFLVRRANRDELAARMREMLTDPQRAASMGLAGRGRAFSSFGLREMARRYEALYEQLLARRGRHKVLRIRSA